MYIFLIKNIFFSKTSRRSYNPLTTVHIHRVLILINYKNINLSILCELNHLIYKQKIYLNTKTLNLL